MDIRSLIQYIRELFIHYVQPNIGTILIVVLIAVIVLTLLRIFIAMIWENILVGIVKISDKKTENEKEDEK